MPEQTTYKGRPCYIRSNCFYVEYLDGNLPNAETVILIDDDETPDYKEYKEI